MAECAVIAFKTLPFPPISAWDNSNLGLLFSLAQLILSKRVLETYMFLVRRIKSVPFVLVGILIASAIKSSFTHALALRILINLTRRHVGTVLLVLVAELGYDGSKIWSNPGLRRRSLGNNRRWLLHLILGIHDRQEFLKVDALSRWRLRHWELGYLRQLRWSLRLRLRLLLLAEHVNCSLKVRRWSLRNWLRRGQRLGWLGWLLLGLVLLGCSLNDLEQVGNVELVVRCTLLDRRCGWFRINIGEVPFLSSLFFPLGAIQENENPMRRVWGFTLTKSGSSPKVCTSGTISSSSGGGGSFGVGGTSASEV